MKLFLDTANIDEIKNAYRLGIISGVTTNPSILLKSQKQREEAVKDILNITDGFVFAQTTSVNCNDIVREAKKLANLNKDRLVIKIPLTIEGIQAISFLNQESVKTLATAVFTEGQAYVAACAGADFIAPYINRMENNGINSINVIQRIRKIYDMNNFKTQILAASFRNVEQVIRSLVSGAHCVTISYDILENLINNSLTDISIKKFDSDWEKLQKYSKMGSII